MDKEYPPRIVSNRPGTWAYSTVRDRLPAIAGRVIAENSFSGEINQCLTRLQEDIHQRAIRHLLDQDAPDLAAWEGYIEPFSGQSWQDVPWFFAEHYFYRRIMEAVEYFQLGLDPFRLQKRQGLERSSKGIRVVAEFLEGNPGAEELLPGMLREGLYFSLWGNQADLSLWPAGSDDDPTHASRQALQDHLLVNDLEQIVKLVCEREQPLPRVDLLLDNAGFELITDLALADLLLGFNLVEGLVLHAKAHPTFVSDVIPSDVDEAVRFLLDQPDPAARSLGARLEDYHRSGRLVATSHFFWNSPLPMWELPDDLGEQWEGSSLVISKGDANFRRLLGDRQWDFRLPFVQVVDYLPAPLAALRSLKAELALGMDQDQIQRISSQDPTWLVDGRWGVIHFAGVSGDG